jgi:hypothetical protein
MKRFTITLLFLTIIIFSSKAQDIDKQKLAYLYSKIGYVKFVDIGYDKNGVDYLISRGAKESQDLVVFKEFISENFGWDFIVTDEQRKQAYSSCKSICEIADLRWSIGTFVSDLLAVGHYPISVDFNFCDGTNVHFEFQINVNGTTISLITPMKKALAKNLSRPEIPFSFEEFNRKHNQVLFANQDIVELLKNKKEKNEIEGVYKLYSNTRFSSISKVAIIMKDDKYYILNIESLYFSDDWLYGEIRGELIPTASDKFMIGKLANVQKIDMDISLNILSKGLIEIENQVTKDKMTFVKLL